MLQRSQQESACKNTRSRTGANKETNAWSTSLVAGVGYDCILFDMGQNGTSCLYRNDLTYPSKICVVRKYKIIGMLHLMLFALMQGLDHVSAGIYGILTECLGYINDP